nr:hypothetical protein [Tanacetum cinerariifolium]
DCVLKTVGIPEPPLQWANQQKVDLVLWAYMQHFSEGFQVKNALLSVNLETD